ncbi:MAG: tetratricopeptide repeat protein, partial [Bacteroidota bacterium]
MRGFLVLAFLVQAMLWSSGSLRAQDSVQVKKLMARTLQMRGYDPEGAIPLADSALRISQALGYVNGQINSLARLGELYTGITEYATARTYLDRAMALAQEAKIEQGVAAKNYHYASLYRITEEFLMALEHYQKGYEIYESLNHQEGMAAGRANLAIMYKVQGDTAAALQSYRQALLLNKELNKVRGEVSTLVNISIIFLEHHKLDSALYYQERALKLTQDHQYPKHEALVLNTRASTLRKMKRYEEALADLEKAEPVFRASNDRYRLAVSGLKFGNLYEDIGKRRLAVQRLEEAEQIAREIGVREIEQAVLQGLERIHRDAGRYESAYRASQRMHVLKDSMQMNKMRRSL